MITVTEKAARKAIALAAQENRAPILRLGVRGGGCSGMSYFYEFDNAAKENDQVWESHGLTVVCDPKSLKLLEGTELDYETNLLKGGFRWRNPQATRSCSCGESFSI